MIFLNFVYQPEVGFLTIISVGILTYRKHRKPILKKKKIYEQNKKIITKLNEDNKSFSEEW